MTTPIFRTAEHLQTLPVHAALPSANSDCRRPARPRPWSCLFFSSVILPPQMQLRTFHIIRLHRDSRLTRQPQRATNHLEYRELMGHSQCVTRAKDEEPFHNVSSSKETPARAKNY